METDQCQDHCQNGKGAVKTYFYISEYKAGLFSKGANKCLCRKHDHICNNLKADAKGHDDTSNDQVDKRVTPGTAETGRNDGHGLVNAETEKKVIGICKACSTLKRFLKSASQIRKIILNRKVKNPIDTGVTRLSTKGSPETGEVPRPARVIKAIPVAHKMTPVKNRQ